jgi:hypothetical protein
MRRPINLEEDAENIAETHDKINQAIDGHQFGPIRKKYMSDEVSNELTSSTSYQ